MGNVIQRWITSVIFQQAPTSVIMRAREKTTVVLLRAWEYPKTGFKLHRNRRCENDRTACWMWRPGLSLLDAEARALPAGCGGQGSPCQLHPAAVSAGGRRQQLLLQLQEALLQPTRQGQCLSSFKKQAS